MRQNAECYTVWKERHITIFCTLFWQTVHFITQETCCCPFCFWSMPRGWKEMSGGFASFFELPLCPQFFASDRLLPSTYRSLLESPSEEVMLLNANCQDTPPSSSTARRSQSHRYSAFKQATERCSPSNLPETRLFSASACYLTWACARPWLTPTGLPNANSTHEGV